MEKKYPVLKCNKELWNKIKPILESFGIDKFASNYFSDHYQNYIVSNWGDTYNDEVNIGITYYCKNEPIENLRYIVNTKEEFLSAVAKLLGKEYPIKEQSSEIKYPCIKCTQQLYDKIKDILKIVGYKEVHTGTFDNFDYLIINYQNKLGQLTNLNSDNIYVNNRYLCSNIEEFLTVACKLQGYVVSYINHTNDNNYENHYFGYCANKETKTIGIYENFKEGGLQAIVVEKSVVPKKQFKKKKERYAVFYDPAIGKDSTVIAVMPTKGNDFDKDKGSDLDIDKNMEKINVANKLKHCKKGTKLYSSIYGEIEFIKVEESTIYIKVIDINNNAISKLFNENGMYDDYPNGECLLFPSKDNRDWNNFQVLEEDHRVMCSEDGTDWGLYNYLKTNVCYCISDKTLIDSWKYIVPVEDFDFTAEDITINKEKSIV